MPKSHFKELRRGKNQSRSGILNTRAGKVLTPFFMPVATRGAVKGLQPAQVSATGAQVLLSNTYHLHIQPGEQVIKKLGGLHQFSHWDGPILTDSGGFQVFSLAKIRKITEEGVYFKNLASGREVLISPEKSMQIQIDLGSDIIMAFDDLSGLSLTDRRRTKEAVERTHRWLQRCIVEFTRLTKGQKESERPLLFGIQQGGLNKELRRTSLEFVQSQSVNGVAIGGLAVGETRKEMYDMLEFLAPLYDPNRVRYLMGVGEPKDIRFSIERGIDMFDCVLPTRNGRHGSVWVTGDKKLNLNNAIFAKDAGPIDKKCDCHTCKSGYSRALLRHLFKVEDPLAGSLASMHNLRYLNRLCEEYKT
ncbi:MAG TPA: tRNA guanosine(34) transglycosylase Tgt [Candidatus Saccharimonadales bacterium]|nr:tRNA guanosine(34) transglycosylase Tgt [Candidatus Saccharimonadales bacterium]